MSLVPATDADLDALAALVNSAYRGKESLASWASEAGMIGGLRTTPDDLRRDLAQPHVHILLHKDDAAPDGLLGCVQLDDEGAGVWLLGMLTVRPAVQARGTGRIVLAEGEAFARARGATLIRMTVVSVRTNLIEWYERRGYADTGERLPYPYGDPPRTDLQFAVLEKRL